MLLLGNRSFAETNGIFNGVTKSTTIHVGIIHFFFFFWMVAVKPFSSHYNQDKRIKMYHQVQHGNSTCLGNRGQP